MTLDEALEEIQARVEHLSAEVAQGPVGEDDEEYTVIESEWNVWKEVLEAVRIARDKLKGSV